MSGAAENVHCVAEVLLYVHRNRRLIRDGSPGRLPLDFHTAPELWLQSSSFTEVIWTNDSKSARGHVKICPRAPASICRTSFATFFAACQVSFIDSVSGLWCICLQMHFDHDSVPGCAHCHFLDFEGGRIFSVCPVIRVSARTDHHPLSQSRIATLCGS